MKYLSIIIPHYNSPDLLQKLLDSIPLKEEIQVIVVDDRSDIEFEKYSLIKESECYAHVLFFENTGKKSAGTCRNIGLEKAIGKWVLFADADDYFTEGFYEIVSKYFESNNDVIFFLTTSIELDTGNISDRHVSGNGVIINYYETKEMKKELKLRYSISTPCAKMINLNLINRHRITFDETIAANDVMFSMQVGYYMEKFQISKEIIYCITRGKRTLTTNYSYEIYCARLNVFIAKYSFLRERIKKAEFDILELGGGGFILSAINFGYPIKEIFKIYKKLRENEIQVLSSRYLNPFTVVKVVKNQLRIFHIKKKYGQKTFKG